ncbi:MAG: anaerobic ribonucleoside-triphosphate reductase activating protein [Candidatus Cloacimonadota bacterium]|nr:MAG: anaerobic ribonucleoside-triphosphate reductase activating protein [Candidatus Cloacimonadota bacterium]
MKFGYLEKFSMIDFPGKLSAVVFTQGCNFRCPYCHNPELVLPEKFTEPLSEDEIFDFLQKRKNQLDAVVITGGEPTMHKSLPEFIKAVKAMGFLVKLDTNGTNPAMLEKLLAENLPDYVAMDIKAPLRKYKDVVKTEVNDKDIRKSIELLKNSSVEYEFRSTIVDSLFDKNDVSEIKTMIQGCGKYFIQNFSPAKTLDLDFKMENPVSEDDVDFIKQQLSPVVDQIMTR